MDRVLRDLITSVIEDNTDFFVDSKTGEVIENKDIFDRINDNYEEADTDIFKRYLAVSKTGGNND